jgi:hypothetical protein
VDDFVLFSDDRKELTAWKEAINLYLEGLYLRLHSGKA